MRKKLYARTIMTIPAKYENGVFKPLGVLKIREGTVVHIDLPPDERLKPKSIRDLGFTGMWADRNDIPDGLSYVNRLREPEVNPR